MDVYTPDIKSDGYTFLPSTGSSIEGFFNYPEMNPNYGQYNIGWNILNRWPWEWGDEDQTNEENPTESTPNNRNNSSKITPAPIPSEFEEPSPKMLISIGLFIAAAYALTRVI